MSRRLAVVTPFKSPSTQQLNSECPDYLKQARFTACLNGEHQRCSKERVNKPEQDVRGSGFDHSLSSLPNYCNMQFNSAHFEQKQSFSHLTTSQTQVATDNSCCLQPPGPSTLCSPSFSRARLPKDFVRSQQFELTELVALYLTGLSGQLRLHHFSPESQNFISALTSLMRLIIVSPVNQIHY
ncbi:hypothetical protein P879_02110 [Paragonimus westermani]|uniref:Uncharacterized protein n=1 Tax=Paragonimus westermani TaxID=34504 RepID=A0A8T0DYU0_9TREM|nr:hypothetical protein P879_02110 [Paragonimus westermani]